MKKTKNRNYSKKEMKRAFSHEETKLAIKMCRKTIKDVRLRKQMIAFIRAADGKKIRNTSGV